MNLKGTSLIFGGTRSGKLTLGSGLFVGPAGVTCDHHFNPRRSSDDFLFYAGDYRVEIFAVVLGKSKPLKSTELAFAIDGQQSAELIQIPDLGLFLRWNADIRKYEGAIDRRPITDFTN
jgi:hypothetical protein